MTVKKLPVYMAEDSLKFLEIIGGKHDDMELGLSSSVNLLIQFTKLVTEDNRVMLTNNELLFCCDILNGGARLTEFETPDSVSISKAMESMQFGLKDAAAGNYGHEVEKWEINPKDFIQKIEVMNPVELFVLAIATRQFWLGIEFSDFRNITNSGSYEEWATQWTE